MEPSTALTALLDVLSRQRDVLERMEHRLTVLRLLAGSGDSRFVAPAADEFEALTHELATLEIAREARTADLTEVVGSAPGAPLSAIVEALGPVGEALAQRGREVRERLEAVSALRDDVEGLSGRAADALRRAQATVGQPRGGGLTYSPPPGPGR